MSHTLKNELLEIKIDLPTEGYKSSRFDYTGKITEVKVRGIPITTKEQLNSSNENDLGKGFYNEFGIDSALGFEEANEGEWFHKIGIGLLRKDDKAYQFNKSYEIRPAQFNTQTDSNSIIINCDSESVNGYSYSLRKEITLQESGFKISYYLENTGTKVIKTTEYNHNFMAINKGLMGHSYELRFPFELNPESFEESVNPENRISFRRNSVCFNENPDEQFFFSRMNGGSNVPAHWELTNQHYKIGISETGSFNTNKVNLWGWKHVVSPELFFELKLEPKSQASWNRTYRIFDIDVS